MTFRAVIDAFVVTGEVEAAIRAAADERLLRSSSLTVHADGLAGAIAHYARAGSAPVVIVEETDDDRTMLERLDHLAEMCAPATRVIVIGRLNDIALYRRLLSSGISDYLVSPVTSAQIAAAIAALFADPTTVPRGKTIAVWSVRGGAGGSTVARNLAWHVGHMVADAAIYLDLDVVFGGADLAFNIEARQGAWEALAQPERLDSVLLDRFLVVHDDYLRLLVSGGQAPKVYDVQPQAAEALLEWSARMAPAVVVDLPHLWAPWSEAVLDGVDEVVVVARPDLTSLRDCKLLFETLAKRRAGSQNPRLVLNAMDLCRKTQLTAKDFQETLGVAPTQVLPWDCVLFGEAANNGQLLVEVNKANKVSPLIEALAAQMMGRNAVQKKSAGWSWRSLLKG